MSFSAKAADATKGSQDPRAFPYGVCVALALAFGLTLGFFSGRFFSDGYENRISLLEGKVRMLIEQDAATRSLDATLHKE